MLLKELDALDALDDIEDINALESRVAVSVNELPSWDDLSLVFDFGDFDGTGESVHVPG
jgi:hypothetical protein